MLTKQEIYELFSEATKHYQAPWKVEAAEDPTNGYFYLRSKDGQEIATFYGPFDSSARALRLIRTLVNDIHEQVEAEKPQEAAAAPAAESA